MVTSQTDGTKPTTDIIVKRKPRRPVTGVAYTMQKTHLVLDEPDAHGLQRYRCQIFDTSDEGFGVSLRVPGGLAARFWPGMRLSIEPSDGRPVRVAIRWIKSEHMGLKRLRPEEDRGPNIAPSYTAAETIGPAEGHPAYPPRKPRRTVTQKCKLVLDKPDGMGVRSHPCRLIDVSEDGFSVEVDAVYPLPELSQVGVQASLEQTNGRSMRVEVRWFKERRYGLRHAAAGH